MNDDCSAQNKPKGSHRSSDKKQRLRSHPLPSPAPPWAPPPPAHGSHWRGLGERAGGLGGARPGRGKAASRASRPPGLGSRWLRFPSRPAVAMEDERKDGAYGRTCLCPAAAFAELEGAWGRETSDILNTRAAAGAPFWFLGLHSSLRRALFPPGCPASPPGIPCSPSG